MHVHVYADTHIHTYINTYVDTCRLINARTYTYIIWAHMQICIRKHTQIHMHAHT